MALAARSQRRGLKWAINKHEREQFKKMLSELDLGLENRLSARWDCFRAVSARRLRFNGGNEKAKLLLLDEHTAALDPKTAAKVLELSDKFIAEGLTAMMVTHNMRDAIAHGNRLYYDEQRKNNTRRFGRRKRKNLRLNTCLRPSAN